MKQPTFTLPADDYIDVRGLPEMLAAAKYPDLDQPQQVTGLSKRAGRATLELDDADKATLRDAWQALPWPAFPMGMDAWQPYADALATSPPPWTLVTHVNDERYTDSMMRVMACETYSDAICNAQQTGTLEVRRELDLLPVAPGAFFAAAFTNGGYVVSRDALKAFAEGAGFKVQRERVVTPAAAPTGHKAKMAKAKAAAHELWKQRELGKLPGFPRNEDFAAECVKRWPILKQSTITQKWIPQWSRERRASRK